MSMRIYTIFAALTCRNLISLPILCACIITANTDIPCGGKLLLVHSSVQWPSDITRSWPGGIIWRQLGSIPINTKQITKKMMRKTREISFLFLLRNYIYTPFGSGQYKITWICISWLPRQRFDYFCSDVVLFIVHSVNFNSNLIWNAL